MSKEYLQKLLSTWFYNKTFQNLETAEKGLVVQAARDLHRAVQQKMHQTAFGVGMLALFAGYVAGWLIFAFKFGGW